MKIDLSPKEKEAILLACDGMIDKEIAQAMGCGVATIRTYWERIRKKTDTLNRAHAIARVAPTLLKQAHEESRVNEELLSFVIRSVDDFALFLVDSSGTLATWNTGVEAIFGYKEADWVGQPCSIFFTREDKRNLEPEEELKEAQAYGRAKKDRWHVRKDGSQFWGSNTVIPFRPAFDRGGYAKIVHPLPPPKK